MAPGPNFAVVERRDTSLGASLDENDLRARVAKHAVSGRTPRERGLPRTPRSASR